jgi:hypothetical protein
MNLDRNETADDAGFNDRVFDEPRGFASAWTIYHLASTHSDDFPPRRSTASRTVVSTMIRNGLRTRPTTSMRLRCPYEIGLWYFRSVAAGIDNYSASERSIHASTDVTVRRTWARPTLRHQVRILIRGQSGSSRRETTRLPAEG